MSVGSPFSVQLFFLQLMFYKSKQNFGISKFTFSFPLIKRDVLTTQEKKGIVFTCTLKLCKDLSITETGSLIYLIKIKLVV